MLTTMSLLMYMEGNNGQDCTVSGAILSQTTSFPSHILAHAKLLIPECTDYYLLTYVCQMEKGMDWSLTCGIIVL